MKKNVQIVFAINPAIPTPVGTTENASRAGPIPTNVFAQKKLTASIANESMILVIQIPAILMATASEIFTITVLLANALKIFKVPLVRTLLIFVLVF